MEFALEKEMDKEIEKQHVKETGPKIIRDEYGQLFCELENKKVSVDVAPCFPWSQPGQYLSIKDSDSGEELFLIESLEDQTLATRSALELYLLEKGFYFQITQVLAVKEEFELRHWQVKTQQGERLFQTKIIDWPMTLENGELCIKDLFGDLYLVEHFDGLDSKSKKLLSPFIN